MAADRGSPRGDPGGGSTSGPRRPSSAASGGAGGGGAGALPFPGAVGFSPRISRHPGTFVHAVRRKTGGSANGFGKLGFGNRAVRWEVVAVAFMFLLGVVWSSTSLRWGGGSRRARVALAEAFPEHFVDAAAELAPRASFLLVDSGGRFCGALRQLLSKGRQAAGMHGLAAAVCGEAQVQALVQSARPEGFRLLRPFDVALLGGRGGDTRDWLRQIARASGKGEVEVLLLEDSLGQVSGGGRARSGAGRAPPGGCGD